MFVYIIYTYICVYIHIYIYILYTYTYPSNFSYTFEMNSFENRSKKYQKSCQIDPGADKSESNA